MYRLSGRKIFFLMVTLIPLFLISGCTVNEVRVSEENIFTYPGKTLAVLGFKPAMAMTDKPGVMRSPFSGAVFMAEPVSRAVTDRMTENVFERLEKKGVFKLIPPQMTTGVLSRLISSGDDMQDIDIYQKIGQALSADAVMAGYIYRWQEREGNEYSVNRPASVAFDIYLIRTIDKVIVWKARFDKTQQSLSENIFDLKFFLKGKGKWMTAYDLADLGLDTVFSETIEINK